MTAEKARPSIPAARCVRVLRTSRPKSRGAGNAGCTTHPLPYAQNKKDARRLNTGPPTSPGTPCAMVLRLLRDLLGEPAFLPPSPASRLTGLSPALAGQDHTA